LGASGALAGAGAEAASLAIAQELYPHAFDADGTFHRDRLSEGQANAILALSGAVGAFVGGVSGGGIQDAVIDANVAQNAVENNDLKTDPRLYGTALVSETEAKEKATQLADGLASTSTQMGRISATAASVGASQTLEGDPMAAASFSISGVTGWISVGSGALEQLVRPNMGKAATDTLFDLISRGVSNRYQSASLFVNETAELAKNNEITQSIQDSINGYFKGDKK
jgi:hypothetical protein